MRVNWIELVHSPTMYVAFRASHSRSSTSNHATYTRSNASASSPSASTNAAPAGDAGAGGMYGRSCSPAPDDAPSD
jgi:hypothetical protein